MNVLQAVTPAAAHHLARSIQVKKRFGTVRATRSRQRRIIRPIHSDPVDLADERFSFKIYIRRLSRLTLRWNSSLGRTGAPTQGAVLMSLALRMVRGASYPN
jgi:hypothetical protein